MLIKGLPYGRYELAGDRPFVLDWSKQRVEEFCKLDIPIRIVSDPLECTKHPRGIQTIIGRAKLMAGDKGMECECEFIPGKTPIHFGSLTVVPTLLVESIDPVNNVHDTMEMVGIKIKIANVFLTNEPLQPVESY
jgi:hypothetical protein